MLTISSPAASAAVNTTRTHVVGPGLTLQSTVNRNVLNLSDEEATAWQRRTEAEFKLWSEDKRGCDALGMNNFVEQQQIIFRSALESGDAFAIIKHKEATPLCPYGLRIALIEADRVCNPDMVGGGTMYGANTYTIPNDKVGGGHRVFDGVEVDSDGCVVAYHVASDYPTELNIGSKELKWTRVKAVGNLTGMPNILHVVVPTRCEQYRGVPFLAPVIEVLLQLRRYTESELMAALVQSMFTAWITTNEDSDEIPVNMVGGTDEQTDSNGNPVDPADMQMSARNDNDYQMGVGTVIHLQPGEDIKFGNPNIPTAGFETFVKTICRLIGAALEIPYDVLIKEFNSSYSASRGALMEAWEMFKMRRSWFVSDFCQPIYEMWLAEAVARGRINAPGFFTDPLIRKAWCGAKWVGPTQVSLDPVKDANANTINANNGFKTRAQATRESGGGDYFENVEQAAKEIEALKASGLRPDGNYAEEPENPENNEEGGMNDA